MGGRIISVEEGRAIAAAVLVEHEGPFSGRALGYVTALRMVGICAEKVRANRWPNRAGWRSW